MNPRDKARALIRAAVDGDVVPCVCREELDQDDCGCPDLIADAVMALFPEVEERLYGIECGGTVAFPAALGEATHARLVLTTAMEEIDRG